MSKYVFLILGSLFFLSACTGNKGIISQWVSSTGYIQDLENAPIRIKATKEFESCMKPSINMCLHQATNQLARDQKSTSLCNELSDASNRDACKFGVISSQTTDMSTINLCDELNDILKKECRINIFQSEALKSSDIKKCDKIWWEFSSWSNDILSSDRIDQCKMNFIIQKKDPSNYKECDLIKNSTTKDMCRSLVKSKMTIELPADVKN